MPGCVCLLAALLCRTAIPAMGKRAVLFARHIDKLVEKEIAEPENNNEDDGIDGNSPIGDRPNVSIISAHGRTFRTTGARCTVGAAAAKSSARLPSRGG